MKKFTAVAFVLGFLGITAATTNSPLAGALAIFSIGCFVLFGLIILYVRLFSRPKSRTIRCVDDEVEIGTEDVTCYTREEMVSRWVRTGMEHPVTFTRTHFCDADIESLRKFAEDADCVNDLVEEWEDGDYDLKNVEHFVACHSGVPEYVMEAALRKIRRLERINKTLDRYGA